MCQGGFRQKVLAPAPRGDCRLRVLSAVGICRGGGGGGRGGGEGGTRQRSSDSKSQTSSGGSCSLYSRETQPSQTERLAFFKFDPLCVPLRRPYNAAASAGFPLAGADVDQIRHIKELIAPLGFGGGRSLSEPGVQDAAKQQPRRVDKYKHGQWVRTGISADTLWSRPASNQLSVNRKSPS